MRANVPSYEKDMHYVESRHMNKKEQALTKFAQPIIKECAEVALREDHDPHECILSHFGVEK